LPPVWGVILVRVSFERNIPLGSKWDCKGYISRNVKG